MVGFDDVVRGVHVVESYLLSRSVIYSVRRTLISRKSHKACLVLALSTYIAIPRRILVRCCCKRSDFLWLDTQRKDFCSTESSRPRKYTVHYGGAKLIVQINVDEGVRVLECASSYGFDCCWDSLSRGYGWLCYSCRNSRLRYSRGYSLL